MNNHHVQSIECFEPDILFDVIANTGFRHRLLSGGPFHGELARLSLPNCRVDRGRYSQSCFAQGACPDEWLMIGFSDSKTRPVWVNGFQTRYDHLQIYAEKANIDYRNVPDVPWYAAQIRREWLQSAALQLIGQELTIPQHGYINMRLPQTTADSLRNILDAAFDYQLPSTGQAAASATQWFETRIVQTIIMAMSQTSSLADAEVRKAENSRQLVETIEKFLNEGQPEAFRLEQLTEETGTGERRLQRFCKDVYGLTPKQLFGVERLHRIRCELTKHQPLDVSVKDVATACGINHLGRFAWDYRKLFAEQPRTTLQRPPAFAGS